MRLNIGKLIFFIFILLALFISVFQVYEYRRLKKIFSEAILSEVTLVDKYKKENDNILSIRMHSKDKVKELLITNYVSNKEYDSLQNGDSVLTYYMTSTNDVYLQSSIIRWSHDINWVWLFPVFLVILGILFRVLFRKYWGRYDETGEYLEDKYGKVIMADKGYKMRNATNAMRLFYWFFKK